MKIIHLYPSTCEYAYPEYLNLTMEDPDKFDREVMCKTDLELRYLHGLYELGSDCTLFYPRRFGLPVKEFTHRGGYRMVRFPVTFAEGDNGKELSLKMCSALKSEKPDLVHFHGLYGGKHFYTLRFFDIMAAFCKRYGIPFFGWYHVGKFHFGNISKILWLPARLAKTAALRSCAGITSVNTVELTRLFDRSSTNYYGIDFSNVPRLLTPNTIDPQYFYPIDRSEAQQKLNLRKDKKYILMVARIFYEKGLHHLINILPQIVECFPEVHLLVIGEYIQGAGEYRDSINRMITDLNLEQYVSFIGRVEHHQGLVLYYNAASVFVLPTLKETFGGVNLEAIACGVPVVSTPCGEIPNYLTPGCGILVEKGDEQALFDALHRILSGEYLVDRQRQMEITQKYAYRENARRLLGFYERVLSGNISAGDLLERFRGENGLEPKYG